MARPEVLQELLGSCERVVQEIDSVSTPHAMRPAGQHRRHLVHAKGVSLSGSQRSLPGRLASHSLAQRALQC